MPWVTKDAPCFRYEPLKARAHVRLVFPHCHGPVNHLIPEQAYNKYYLRIICVEGLWLLVEDQEALHEKSLHLPNSLEYGTGIGMGAPGAGVMVKVVTEWTGGRIGIPRAGCGETQTLGTLFV